MMQKPQIVSASFLVSAPHIGLAPPEEKSEIVFLGRSNVGKSSTLNTLCGRKNLAKSSSTPGKTQLINFFDVAYRLGDETYPLRFVDLPGFGYAKVSKSLKEVWQKHLFEFVTHRKAIRLFIHLRDARHPQMQIDQQVSKVLEEICAPDQRVLTAFTKIDKLNQKERAKLKRLYPEAITLSNLKKTGFERMHSEILKTVFGVSGESGEEL